MILMRNRVGHSIFAGEKQILTLFTFIKAPKLSCLCLCSFSGLILPNGDINWNCPCLGGMASGPCGSQFKEAFSCFHYSKEEVKGSECIDHFRNMQECMQKYPELYPQEEDKAESSSASAPAVSTEGSAISPQSDSVPEMSVPNSTLPADE